MMMSVKLVVLGLALSIYAQYAEAFSPAFVRAAALRRALRAFTGTECREGYTEFGGACYAVMRLNKNFNGADNFCMFSEAALVAIEDQEEFDFVTGLLQEEGPREKKVLLGMSDKRTPGTYETPWSDEISFFNWNQNEPSGRPGENCVYMKKDFKYKSSRCTSKMPFLCKYSFDDVGLSAYVGAEPFVNPKKESGSVRGKLVIPRPNQGTPVGMAIMFTMYTARTDSAFPLILRPDGAGSYHAVSSEEFTPWESGYQKDLLELDDRITTQEGDIIGLLFMSKNPITYAVDEDCSHGNTLVYDVDDVTEITGGSSFTPTVLGGNEPCRDYHVQLVLSLD